MAQDGLTVRPELNVEFAMERRRARPRWPTSGQPGRATAATDEWLDAVTTGRSWPSRSRCGWGITTNYGSLMLRAIDHHWYHIGESMAVRQLLGHTGLPDFVGDIDTEAPLQTRRNRTRMTRIERIGADHS